ncbi:MAG: nucleotidyltransferase domain-containing protein [Methanobacteriaceae archaeon]|nr:nucleotidyltransferase domain-containing protein [Methanobacteriaceae archaeon]
MDALKKITRQLKDQDEIAFAYIYGSVARGEEREDSDIDIAAYLTHHPTLEYPFFEKKQTRDCDNCSFSFICN